MALIVISSKRQAVHTASASVASFCTSSFYYIKFLPQRKLFYRTHVSVRSSIKCIVVSWNQADSFALREALRNANLGDSETIYWLEWKDTSSSESKQTKKILRSLKSSPRAIERYAYCQGYWYFTPRYDISAWVSISSMACSLIPFNPVTVDLSLNSCLCIS